MALCDPPNKAEAKKSHFHLKALFLIMQEASQSDIPYNVRNASIASDHSEKAGRKPPRQNCNRQ